MSYCRFSLDSDVYLYEHVDGHFECCSCRLAKLIIIKPTYSMIGLVDEPFEMHDNKIMKTRKEALKHLKKHRVAGHIVPTYAIEKLQKEIGNEQKKK